MLKFENGDIVTGDYPFIVQQVNCKGKMGAGLAKQLCEKYPAVYYDYKELCDDCKAQNKPLLGHVQMAHLTYGINPRYCFNMFAQKGYGRDKRYTNYDAFQACLDKLAEKISYFSVTGYYNTIAFPYKIGCGLGGGDWNIIFNMIDDFSKKIEQDVIIVCKDINYEN